MAFKNNSVPSFVARHEYRDEIPGYAVPSALTIARVVPPAFANLAAVKGWTSLSYGQTDVEARAACQANANEIWQSLRALAGMIALMNTVNPGPFSSASGANIAANYYCGEISGSGNTVTVPAVPSVQTPCWLYAVNSRYGSSRVAAIVYQIVDNGNGTSTLYLLQALSGVKAAKENGSLPLTATLFGYPKNTEWTPVGANSDPRACFQDLLYSYPWRYEQVNVFGDQPSDFSLIRVGHPSLSSLVSGCGDAAGVRYKKRTYPGSGGWSKALTKTGASGQPVLFSTGGLEFLSKNGSDEEQDLLDQSTWTADGPAATRAASNIEWANTPATSNNDYYKAFRNSALRGLQAQHRYTKAVIGGQGAIEYRRTWLLFADIPQADGEYLYPDGKIINGYWNAYGDSLPAGSPYTVYRRKIQLTHGIMGDKTAKPVHEPATVKTVRVGLIESQYEVAGATHKIHLRHGQSDFAKSNSATEEDVIVTCKGAGLIVLPKSGSRFTNHACHASVEGQGGFVHAGHCLQIPSDSSIPDGLRGRLLPILAAVAGYGNNDPAFDSAILDSGIAGKPLNYSDWAAKMDCVFILDADDVFGALEYRGIDLKNYDAQIVRNGVCSNIYSVNASENEGSSMTALTTKNIKANGQIFIADRTAQCLSVDCELYVQEPQMSAAGDDAIKICENIFANGYDFSLAGGYPADSKLYSLSLRIYEPSEPYIPDTHDWVQSGGSWKKVVIGPTGYVTEYTYSYAIPSANTQATMGTVINSEMAARVADCVYYNPLQTFTSPELDRLPVGGSGIAGAFGNLTMLDPVLHETSFVNLTNFYTTSTSPQVDTFLFGVVNNGGDYSYCALGSGLGTTGVASNIPVKQDLTQIVKAYADNIANFQSFAFAFVASGFSVNPTQAIGPDFMVDFLWKTYSNNVTWSGGFITGGEVRAKRLTYGGASLANCHVSLSPAAFELPAGCRVN